jgi:hypothetical protein
VRHLFDEGLALVGGHRPDEVTDCGVLFHDQRPHRAYHRRQGVLEPLAVRGVDVPGVDAHRPLVDVIHRGAQRFPGLIELVHELRT